MRFTLECNLFNTTEKKKKVTEDLSPSAKQERRYKNDRHACRRWYERGRCCFRFCFGMRIASFRCYEALICQPEFSKRVAIDALKLLHL